MTRTAADDRVTDDQLVGTMINHLDDPAFGKGCCLDAARRLRAYLDELAGAGEAAPYDNVVHLLEHELVGRTLAGFGYLARCAASDLGVDPAGVADRCAALYDEVAAEVGYESAELATACLAGEAGALDDLDGEFAAWQNSH